VKRTKYDRYTKRLLDTVLAAALLILFAPLLLLLALLVALLLGLPVLFTQQRPGYQGRPFRLLKFRTMSDAASHDGRLLSDAERLTRFGRLLRASSLDELPELWNVLCGHMSFVGPRPLLMEYLPLYTPEQRRRHNVRPGITGWAQVNGRNDLTWEQKFELDLWYVDHLSFALDVRIFLVTLRSVLFARGVSQSGHATMPPFQGSDR
jgi:lipopolysaccharide/colanic/teichoic acid biosynthesis glycosyltransferase